MTKHLYQLPVPERDNEGQTISPWTHHEFLKHVAELCGGYTAFAAADGAWIDPETGVTHRERMIPLQFAATEQEAGAILAQFFAHFPDQKCAMLAKLGTVTFPEPMEA